MLTKTTYLLNAYWIPHKALLFAILFKNPAVTLKEGVIMPALQRRHMIFRDDLTPRHPENRWWNQYRGFSVGFNLYSQYQNTLAGKVAMGTVNVSKSDIRSISLTLHKSIQNRSKTWNTDIHKPLEGNFRKTLQDGAMCKKLSKQDSNSTGNTPSPN